MLAAAVIVFVTCAVAWILLRASEPIFKGRRLSVWLEGYQISKYSVGSPQRKAADEAMQHLGTNTIPTLLGMMRSKDSSLKLKFLDVIQKQPLMKVNFIPASARKYCAWVAFGVLGGSASNAEPKLIRIYQEDASLQTRNAVIIALGHIGPPAKEAFPLLEESVTSTNFPLRANAANAIKAINSEAAAQMG